MVVPLISFIIFGGCVLFIFWIGRFGRDDRGMWYFQSNFISLFLVGIFTIVLYWLTSSSLVAWFLLVFFFSITLIVEIPLTYARKRTIAWLIRISLSIFVGLFCILFNQIETRFSEEEFFTAIQFFVLSGFWFLIYLFTRLIPVPKTEKGHRFSTKTILPILITSFLFIIAFGIRSYQDSFFPMTVGSYPGISESQPFLCGKVEQDSMIYSSSEVYADYIKRIQLNPGKDTPDYGFLALATGDINLYEKFKELLLLEAEQGEFTQPSNSIKYTQYLASLRVYFYQKILDRKPDLFSSQEQQIITTWFHKINQRALKIEWVDWLYALAFSMFPKGPYENQDIGSGLLSLLEEYQLSDPHLVMTNQQYLQTSIRGWFTRFRNIDDAFFYQSEWMDNALFQSIYSGFPPKNNFLQSKKWLLLQTPPDGFPLKYNQPSPADVAGSMLQSFDGTSDSSFLWLAGRVLKYTSKNGDNFRARPGIEIPIKIEAESPDLGSCLIFGDSGLPNQQGPLAPDKIVFRNGWANDSKYLALNLRFTGWHRYKATNNIILYYNQTPLIVEQTEGALFNWLPEGRSLFRDKRIPRENLNGLVVGKIGLDYVISILTGIGSQWAQDPPFYAQVEEFYTNAELDYSRTAINDWNNWSHLREVFFFHQGPTIIVDQLFSKSHNAGGLVWHFEGFPELEGNDLFFEKENKQFRISLHTNGKIKLTASSVNGTDQDQHAILTVHPKQLNKLLVVTAIFDQDQIDQTITTIDENGQAFIELESEKGTKRIPVHPYLYPGNFLK